MSEAMISDAIGALRLLALRIMIDAGGAGYAITAKGRAYYADSGMEVEV